MREPAVAIAAPQCTLIRKTILGQLQESTLPVPAADRAIASLPDPAKSFCFAPPNTMRSPRKHEISPCLRAEAGAIGRSGNAHDGAFPATFASNCFACRLSLANSEMSEEASIEIRPISHTSTNDRVLDLVVPFIKPGVVIADIGAGEGYFSQLVGEYARSKLGLSPSEIVAPCDLFPEFFRYPSVTCAPIGAAGRLPYDDSSVDVACSLEVVEHLEDQFAFARELFRILRPGGTAILSTPNILNLNSRWRNLHSGFAVLFDPLLLSSNDPRHTSGHINPVSYYYLAYQLRRAGFASTSVTYDRFKRSARFLMLLLAPIVYTGNLLLRGRLEARKSDVMAENRAILADLWSARMMTSRSIITLATR